MGTWLELAEYDFSIKHWPDEDNCVADALSRQARPLVELLRDKNMANLNKLRLIAKFGMIVYYKIVINNLI